MEIGNPIENLLIEVRDKTLVARYDRPFKVASSATLNGGLTSARSIINCQVPMDYNHKNPERLLQSKANELRAPSPVVGLLTAVDMKNLSITSGLASDRRIVAIATAGLSNATRLGEKTSAKVADTINVIVFYEGNMTDGCMINAVQTATESKCATLQGLDALTRDTKVLATGTSTDSVAVCCLGKGEELRYAGSATEIGTILGRIVESTIRDSLKKQENLVSGRPIASRLEERGIRIEDILETCIELFVPHPGIQRIEKARKILREELEKALADINICCLISAGMRLEEDGKMGLIPQIGVNEFATDPLNLLADEMIGRQIAGYIGGTRAGFEFQRFDRKKPGILRSLGPFMDDVVAGLASGISSKMYSTRLEATSHDRNCND